MLLGLAVLAAALASSGAHALATPNLHKRFGEPAVKHSWVEVPEGWMDDGSVPPADHTINLRIGLKQNKIDVLIEQLYEVSDPTSASYGKHLSKEQVEALVAPHPDTVALVEEWLAAHDISPAHCSRSPAGDWLSVNVPVSKAERLLDTNYRVFRRRDNGNSVVRALSYSLPRFLHDHIDVVTPTTMFGSLHEMRSTGFIQPSGFKAVTDDAEPQRLVLPGRLATLPASCGTTITPTCLRILYATDTYVPAATGTNKLGVAGYLGEFANDADLQTFFRQFRTDAVGQTLTHVQLNGGGNNQSQPGVEANLDVQYTEGISSPTPNIYYSTGGSPPFTPDSATPTNTNEPYMDWLNFILNQTTIPQTFTTSYGDDEQTVPNDFAVRVCNQFAQLGARGSSIMFSSGDSGVGAGSCRTNDGTNKVVFQPTFPAGCPFVTAVGGTTRVNPEVAVSFSQGGFSNYFARPSYQDAAVSKFLTGVGTKFQGLFNPAGRGFPDVAAQGNGFQVIRSGRVISVGGTSASSPTFAAVVSLLNDFRIASGKAPLGFLNPLLYSSLVPGFNDITSGSNPGCGTTGFTAVAGWDAVTGLGTPNFTTLKNIVAGL
ncbi:subtilisin-like protein [Exidia glandulosa HHB12029]|uniref:tripeptidyl-peptidase II n=1 Tax=Exidia glandulosa HHB12029 TaxID=1314781 RepID=A0A165HIB7_EXIGL|nr:subtilisin-like protein [Exidia glandulosa HHB12029]